MLDRVNGLLNKRKLGTKVIALGGGNEPQIEVVEWEENPESALIRLEIWNAILEKRQKKSGGMIVPDGDSSKLIDEAGEAIMFPGPQFLPTEVSANRIIGAVNARYDHLVALRSRIDYRRLNPDLKTGLGVVTLPVTSDGYLVLTLRPEDIDFYPGAFHGPGGGISPGDLQATIPGQFAGLREVYEELNIPEATLKMQFLGISEDPEYGSGRPELMYWVRLPYDKAAVEAAFAAHRLKPRDVAQLHFIGRDLGDVQAVLRQVLCPPTAAALAVLSWTQFNISLEELLNW